MRPFEMPIQHNRIGQIKTVSPKPPNPFGVRKTPSHLTADFATARENLERQKFGLHYLRLLKL